MPSSWICSVSQPGLVKFCKENNVEVVAYSPLCSPGSPWEAGRKDLLKNEVIEAIAKKHNRTPAQVALKWNIGRGVPVIPKTSNKGRAKENIESLDFALDEEDRKEIEKLECGVRAFDSINFDSQLNVPTFQ